AVLSGRYRSDGASDPVVRLSATGTERSPPPARRSVPPTGRPSGLVPRPGEPADELATHVVLHPLPARGDTLVDLLDLAGDHRPVELPGTHTSRAAQRLTTGRIAE